MAYSYTEHVGTAGGTTGPFSFGPVALLSADTESIATQIKVYKNGVLLTITTNYTLDAVNKEITTTAPIFNTDVLKIVRETKADSRYVDYQDATNVTANLLDLDSNQLFYLVQEAYDLQTDSMVRDTDGQWNARGYRIKNLGTAVNGTDAVNYNQLLAATSGALPASLSGYGYIAYNGDGATSSFLLPAAVSSITDASDVEVYLNGIRQIPTQHYTIVSAAVLFSSYVPSVSDKILIVYPEGTVSAVLTANSVTTTSIQANAVTLAKIQPGSNGEVLVTKAGVSDWEPLDSTYISNFNAAVQSNSISSMTAAAASLNLNSNKIINLATPTNATDAATKLYVDTAAANPVATASYTVPSNTTSTLNCSFTTTVNPIGLWTILVPYRLSGNIEYAVISGVCSSSFTSSVYPVSVYQVNLAGTSGTRFAVYFTRTSGNQMTFTVNATTSPAGTITWNAGDVVWGHFVRGSN